MTSVPQSPADLSRPLSDLEFDELDAALRALPEGRDAMDVAMLEGYLVGVLLQPEMVMPSEWLRPIFGAPDGEAMIPGDEAGVTRVLNLVMRHYNTLASHIHAREPFDPMLYDIETTDGHPPSREQEITALWPWAAGFANAMNAFPDLLDLSADDSDLAALLLEVFRHAPIDPDDGGEGTRELREMHAQLDRDRPLDNLDDAVATVVDAVLDIADITHPREPLIRSEPKVGRNDPCPCGSGRKYKRCHGVKL